ncbi:MAG TPA: hypothetical protein P5257_08055 [Bacteroidales bacterium]|nr:hypothetical protein [Bacteroidales bacterium]HRR93718.1 hypothetical protein [Bacteroidales bacterium]HRT90058.1 hypothetical protein [Bacteroidales bacterium]
MRKYEITRIFAVILCLLSPKQELIAQADSTVYAGSDSMAGVSGKKESIHGLFAGLGYGNNMVYMGSTISGNKPYSYASLTYSLANKLFLSGSAVHLSDTDPFMAFYTLSATFSHTFNSWFDISAGISRYNVHSSLTDTLFGSFTYGEIDLGIDWKILYTKLCAGGFLVEGAKPYYQIKNSRYFQTPEFSKKKLHFSFEPYFNLLFGTVTRSETTTGVVSIYTTPPYRKQGNSGYQTVTTTKYTNIFGLMEMDMGIPVSFNSDRITFEVEPGYIYPMYDDSVYPGTKGFQFLVGLYLKIL